MKRFWDKVKIGQINECWEWLACKDGYGYGLLKIDGKMRGAHRFSYELTKGTIPKHMYILHSCDNPGCVNPSHLRIGTPKDNMHDMIAKGRGKKTKGDNHFAAKLTSNDIRCIRWLCPRTKQKTIAEMFGVTQGTISGIINRNSWNHIT